MVDNLKVNILEGGGGECNLNASNTIKWRWDWLWMREGNYTAMYCRKWNWSGDGKNAFGKCVAGRKGRKRGRARLLDEEHKREEQKLEDVL